MWLFTNSFEPKMWEMNSAFSILENRRYLLLCATAAVQQQWLHLDFRFVFTQKFNCGRQSFAGHFTETRKRGKNLRNSNRSFKCCGTSCACQISQIKSKWNSEHHCQLPLMNAARNGNQVDIRQQCATFKNPFVFFIQFGFTLIQFAGCTRSHRHALNTAVVPLTESNWTELKQLFSLSFIE